MKGAWIGGVVVGMGVVLNSVLAKMAVFKLCKSNKTHM